MARRRRSQKTTLNFEGLTDAVTNLTGTLILLVVLLLGATHVARPGGSDHSETPKGEKLVEPLLQQVHALELEVQLIDREVRLIESQCQELKQRVENLREKSKLGARQNQVAARGPHRPALSRAHWNPAAGGLRSFVRE